MLQCFCGVLLILDLLHILPLFQLPTIVESLIFAHQELLPALASYYFTLPPLSVSYNGTALLCIVWDAILTLSCLLRFLPFFPKFQVLWDYERLSCGFVYSAVSYLFLAWFDLHSFRHYLALYVKYRGPHILIQRPVWSATSLPWIMHASSYHVLRRFLRSFQGRDLSSNKLNNSTNKDCKHGGKLQIIKYNMTKCHLYNQFRRLIRWWRSRSRIGLQAFVYSPWEHITYEKKKQYVKEMQTIASDCSWYVLLPYALKLNYCRYNIEILWEQLASRICNHDNVKLWYVIIILLRGQVLTNFQNCTRSRSASKFSCRALACFSLRDFASVSKSSCNNRTHSWGCSSTVTCKLTCNHL